MALKSAAPSPLIQWQLPVSPWMLRRPTQSWMSRSLKMMNSCFTMSWLVCKERWRTADIRLTYVHSLAVLYLCSLLWWIHNTLVTCDDRLLSAPTLTVFRKHLNHFFPCGDVAQWLWRLSLAGRLSLICGWHVITYCVKCLLWVNSAFRPSSSM